MRRPTANRPSLLVLLAFLPVACQSSPPPLLPSLPPTPNRSFSAEAAWQHLNALSQVGSRAPGSEGAKRARSYIAAELAKLGLEVDEQPFMIDLSENETSLELTNVAVTIPGASQDLIVLAAPYDTVEFEPPPLLGVNDGASGPALLLELARVLSAAPLAYSTRLLFLEGEQRTRVGNIEMVNFGSKAMARWFTSQQVMPRIRLFVIFNRVAGTDLRILRDRRSHRFTREAFWDAAAQMGHSDAFPRSAPFDSPDAGHVSFLEAGLRPAAAIVGAEPPAAPSSDSESEEVGVEDTLECCSAESLQTVGIVTLQTLETQSQRLARIDRVSGVPVPARVPEVEPQAGQIEPEAAEIEPGAEAAGLEAPVAEPQASEAASPDQLEPQAAPPEASASGAGAEAPKAEAELQAWEIEPQSLGEPEQQSDSAAVPEVAPATPLEEAPEAAGPLCANDGLSRCPRVPRAAGQQRPSTREPEAESRPTEPEAGAATP